MKPSCAQPGVNPDWWFPEEDEFLELKAKTVCYHCPVQEECWEFSKHFDFQFPENDAILAGKTYEQRVRHRSRLLKEEMRGFSK